MADRDLPWPCEPMTELVPWWKFWRWGASERAEFLAGMSYNVRPVREPLPPLSQRIAELIEHYEHCPKCQKRFRDEGEDSRSKD